MAIAIDASTPAFTSKINSFGLTLTTASFTPPAGALLVCGMAQTADAGTTFTLSDNLGTHLTYSNLIKSTGAGLACSQQIQIADVVTSAAMTCTATASNNHNSWAFGVVVVTGAKAVASQTGQTIAAQHTTTTISATLSSLVGSNSLVVGMIADITSATAPTIPGGQSDSFNSQTFAANDATNLHGEWMQYLTGMNLSSGASATINDTAPAADSNGMVVAEILAAAVGLPDLIMAPPHG